MVENLTTCKTCGESASGPDKASVAAAMKRHAKKHPKAPVTRNPKAKK